MSKTRPDLKRLIELQRLLLTFSQIERHIDRSHNGGYVKENDTEHSYNLAMTAWFLARSFPELNVDTVLRYALAHDVVEVHAGDTYIYGSKADLRSKAAREAAALERLTHDWPDFTDLVDTIRAYETKADPEARFVYALDKVIPILTIYIHDGYTWHNEAVTLKMLDDAKREKVALSPEILPYFEAIYQKLSEHPELIRQS